MNDIQRSEEQILNKIKMARIKSAFLSTTGIIPILFICIPFFSTFSLFFKVEAYLLLILVPFGFMYQLTFGYLFGRDVLTEVEKRRTYFKYTQHNIQDEQGMIDAINTANGYGPGLSGIVGKAIKHH